MTSTHSWGPEAVGCSLLLCSPDPAGSFPPGQLREGAAGLGPRPGKGKQAGVPRERPWDQEGLAALTAGNAA